MTTFASPSAGTSAAQRYSPGFIASCPKTATASLCALVAWPFVQRYGSSFGSATLSGAGGGGGSGAVAQPATNAAPAIANQDFRRNRTRHLPAFAHVAAKPRRGVN